MNSVFLESQGNPQVVETIFFIFFIFYYQTNKTEEL